MASAVSGSSGFTQHSKCPRSRSPQSKRHKQSANSKSSNSNSNQTQQHVLAALTKLAEAPEDTSAAVGAYVASELRGLPEEQRDWMIRTMKEMFYQLKTADRSGGAQQFQREIDIALRETADNLFDG